MILVDIDIDVNIYEYRKHEGPGRELHGRPTRFGRQVGGSTFALRRLVNRSSRSVETAHLRALRYGGQPSPAIESEGWTTFAWLVRLRDFVASARQACLAEARAAKYASEGLAGSTRLELATSGVTGRRSNQLNYDPARSYYRGALPHTPARSLAGPLRPAPLPSRRAVRA